MSFWDLLLPACALVLVIEGLLPFIRPGGWRRLFEQYPDRFIVGSDTWVNERWGQYASIMNGYRDWLAELPQEVAEKIAFRNAERLFRK